MGVSTRRVPDAAGRRHDGLEACGILLSGSRVTGDEEPSAEYRRTSSRGVDTNVIIIPIGQEGAVRRTPVVTISLIVIMTLIHCYTHTAFQRQAERYQYAFEHYNELLFTYASELRSREYDDPGSGDMPEIGLSYANSVRAMQKYMEEQVEKVDAAMESGELYPLDSPEYEEWIEAKNELKEAKENIVFHRFGFTPSKPSFFTLISSMFFHGGIMHLVFNLVFLWAAGVMMESSWGHAVYGASYFISGIAATLFHWLSAPGSAVPCVGASGAIAGMMGAYLVVHFSEKVHIFWLYFLGFTFRAGTAKCPAFILLGLWIIGQIFWAFLSADLGDGAGVAYWAHIGGFGFGMLLAFAIRLTGWEQKLHVDGPPPTDDAIRETLNGFVEQARELYKDGKKGEARTVLERLLDDDRDLPGAHHLLGRIHAEKSEFTKAKYHLESAITGYCAARCSEAALEAFEELKPNCAEGDITAGFVFDLARAVENGGDPEKAAPLFIDVATKFGDDPYAPKAGLRAGMLYEQSGNLGAAKQIYRYVEKNSPDRFFREEAENRLRALEGQADKTLA